jgi:hypothetical protein
MNTEMPLGRGECRHKVVVRCGRSGVPLTAAMLERSEAESGVTVLC